MRELAVEEQTPQLDILQGLISSFPSLLMPPSETASYNTLIELKSGVGGAESSLFLNDLLRMYTRYAEHNGWTTQVNLGNSTDSGGTKDASIDVKGEGSYENLRWESGVHRVQRVPATEAGGRLHTSTAVVIVSILNFIQYKWTYSRIVKVLPVPEEKSNNEPEELFQMKDVRIEVMRSRGAGGQVMPAFLVLFEFNHPI